MTQTITAAGATAAPAPAPSRQWELDALRVVAIAGVVAIHVIGLLRANDAMAGTQRWWASVVVHTGSIWVVPVFVMISGALVLAPRAHVDGPAAFYRKRFARILPALVVWHVVYLVAGRVLLRGERPDATRVTVLLLDGRIYTAMYFLWLIAGLYVIAPVLVAFLRDGGRRRALATAGAALSWTLLSFVFAGVAALLGVQRPIEPGAWAQWWPYVGYFLAGWALHRVVPGRRGMVAAAVVAVLALAELIWQDGHPDRYRALHELLPVSRTGTMTAVASIAVFLLAVGLGARLRPGPRVTGVLRRLSDATFGVFLVHLLILEVIRQSVPEVMAGSSFGVLVAAYGVVLVAAFAVSLAAARVRFLRAIF